MLKIIAIAGVILLGIVRLFNDFDTPTKRVQPEKLNAFIQKENILNPKISYGVPRDGVVFGGLEKGSFGLIIHNNDILQHGSYYKLIIDGESKTYDYNRETYLIMQDNRIWNPVPQVTIEFLSKQKKTLFKQTF